VLQNLIEAAPKICSAPNMSRHGRFPTSARLFPVDYVAGQWDFEGMPVIARAPVKVLAAYKWVQAKLHRPLLSELRAPNTESFRDAIGGGSCKLRHRKQPRPDDRKAKSRKVSSPAIGRSASPPVQRFGITHHAPVGLN
jgi:hypothetical protein